MTLVDRISALALAIQAKFNDVTPRLPVSGGAAGQVLSKATVNSYEYTWADVFGPTSLTFGGGLKKTGPKLTTTGAIAFSTLGVPGAAQVLASFFLPYDITVDAAMCGGIAKTAPTGAFAVSLKRAGVTVVTWAWASGALVPTTTVGTAALAAGNFTLEAQAQADPSMDSPSTTLGFYR
jgi:hypothetical protein